jgi:hypothetical protein
MSDDSAVIAEIREGAAGFLRAVVKLGAVHPDERISDVIGCKIDRPALGGDLPHLDDDDRLDNGTADDGNS